MTTREHKLVLEQTADAVAEHLGDGWATEPTGERWGPHLVGPDGVRLELTNPDYDRLERVHIAGIYPSGRNWRANRVVIDAINVRLSRGPETIAKEINRRLLPGFLPALREAQAWYAAQERKAELVRATCEELAELVAGQTDKGRGFTPRDDEGRVRFGVEGEHLSVEVHGTPNGQHATFELRYKPVWMVKAALQGVMAAAGERAQLQAVA